jgi:hypothetical protein
MIDPVGTMIHHANAPLPGVLRGIEWYKGQGVSPHKIDMLLPWYSYDFVCDNLEPGPDCIPLAGFPHTNPGIGQVLDLHAAVVSQATMDNQNLNLS